MRTITAAMVLLASLLVQLPTTSHAGLRNDVARSNYTPTVLEWIMVILNKYEDTNMPHYYCHSMIRSGERETYFSIQIVAVDDEIGNMWWNKIGFAIQDMIMTDTQLIRQKGYDIPEDVIRFDISPPNQKR